MSGRDRRADRSRAIEALLEDRRDPRTGSPRPVGGERVLRRFRAGDAADRAGLASGPRRPRPPVTGRGSSFSTEVLSLLAGVRDRAARRSGGGVVATRELDERHLGTTGHAGAGFICFRGSASVSTPVVSWPPSPAGWRSRSVTIRGAAGDPTGRRRSRARSATARLTAGIAGVRHVRRVRRDRRLAACRLAGSGRSPSWRCSRCGWSRCWIALLRTGSADVGAGVHRVVRAAWHRHRGARPAGDRPRRDPARRLIAHGCGGDGDAEPGAAQPDRGAGHPPALGCGARKCPIRPVIALVADLRHGQHVEAPIELLLGEFLADQAAIDDRLPNRLVALEGLLGHRGGLLVADRRVQRGHDRGRRLGQSAQSVLVGHQAVDAALRRTAGTRWPAG